jgi:hypothetical protein
MRYFAGSFWTPKTDAQLQRLEAKTAAKIAAKLGTDPEFSNWALTAPARVIAKFSLIPAGTRGGAW